MKYIQVPVFSKGEFVQVNLKKGARPVHGGYNTGLLGRVIEQSGTQVIMETPSQGRYRVEATELIESNAKVFEAAKPKTLKVRSLDRELKIIDRTTLQVGCQRINKGDAQTIVAFIQKNLLDAPKATAKKATKKAKRK